MCGIAGFFSNDINFEVNDKYRKILVQMKKSLYHRGPDDSGIYLKEHCGFAHTRLAIRDVKYGRQPMKRTINNNENYKENNTTFMLIPGLFLHII